MVLEDTLERVSVCSLGQRFRTVNFARTEFVCHTRLQLFFLKSNWKPTSVIDSVDVTQKSVGVVPEDMLPTVSFWNDFGSNGKKFTDIYT